MGEGRNRGAGARDNRGLEWYGAGEERVEGGSSKWAGNERNRGK